MQGLSGIATFGELHAITRNDVVAEIYRPGDSPGTRPSVEEKALRQGSEFERK